MAKARISELFSVLGGTLAVSAIVFGAGLYLLGASASQRAHDEHPIPKEEAKHGAEAVRTEEFAGEPDEPAMTVSEHEMPTRGAAGTEKMHNDGHESPEDAKEPPKVRPAGDYAECLAAGDAAMARGRPEKAAVHYLAATAYSKDARLPPELLFRLAQATVGANDLPVQKRYEKALGYHAKILMEYPDSPHAERSQYELGVCYFKLGRIEEAREAFEQHLARFPSGAFRVDACLDLVDIYLAARKPSMAQEVLVSLKGETMTSEKFGRMEASIARTKLDLARHLEEEAKVEAPISDKGEVINVKKASPAEEPKPEKPREDSAHPHSEEPSTSIPPAVWQAAVHSLDIGQFSEARRLLSPWNEDPQTETREEGRRLLAWAELLRTSCDSRAFRGMSR